MNLEGIASLHCFKMRQRITFLQEPQHSVDPKLLKITSTAISTPKLTAAREERVTFTFDELPQELYRVLKASHELHIRWASPSYYSTIAPLVSRLSPGLHVFYTPQLNKTDSSLLCPILKKVFGTLDCLSPEESFTTLPVDSSSPSRRTQYYQPLNTLHDLVEYGKHKLCASSDQECVERVSNLLHASSVDIDFDAASLALKVTAFWPSQTQDINIRKTDRNDRLEVGILSVEASKQLEELSLGGFLTEVGEDTKPSPTLFSFPARHHPSASTYSAYFLTPTGLHPTLELQLGSSNPPTEERSCSLHAHLTLPRAIFADRHQFSDPLFLASKNLSALHYITTPVDLEAPVYAVLLWGSSLLLELSPPSGVDQPWAANIPLHLRYLHPTEHTSGQSQLEVPYPVVFWACSADEESTFSTNPFDKANIGYDGLFGPKTMFYHFSPNQDKLINTISVPVLDLDKSKYVEASTAGVVLIGFLWVMWCVLGVMSRYGYGSGSRKIPKGKKKQ